MLFRKITSAFLSVSVMISLLTINGFAESTGKDSIPLQEVRYAADNDGNADYFDNAQAVGELPLKSEGSVSVGAFTVTGGELDKDFSYSDSILTVLTEVPLTISNTQTDSATDMIAVAKDVSANITLSGVNIDVSSTSRACAFNIADDSTGNVIITLLGINVLKSGSVCAGLQKNGEKGSLTIGGTGSLTVTGGSNGSGIGSSGRKKATDITIVSGTVIATGGQSSAGIGGTSCGDATNITISGGNVTATGGSQGSGIGSGFDSNAKNIIISGGTVIATGGWLSAGIGGGDYGDGKNITISGGTVTATGGSESAGIGGGDSGSAYNIKISGGTVTAIGGGGSIVAIGGDKYTVGNIFISGGSVKVNGIIGSSSSTITPTNGAESSEKVYPLVVENPNKDTIIIDGQEYTPNTHNDENRIYVYLTAEQHTVQIGKTTKRFSFVDGAFAEEFIAANVVSHGLTSGNLGVEFYMSLGDSIITDENAYMLFTLASGKTQQIYVKDAGSIEIDNEECFVFPCYVAPAEISDVFSAQIVTGENETSDVFTYSLAEQCENMVNSGSSEAEIALAKAILNYGTQAQLFFEHNTENPANASLDENDREPAAISFGALMDYRYNIVDNDDDIDFIGQVVQLNNNVAVKFYFSGNIDVSKCRVNGKRISAEDIGKDNYGSYIIIRNIMPEDLDESYTLTVGSVTISNAGAFSYLYTALRAQRADLYQIVYALYAFNKAAEAYFS